MFAPPVIALILTCMLGLYLADAGYIKSSAANTNQASQVENVPATLLPRAEDEGCLGSKIVATAPIVLADSTRNHITGLLVTCKDGSLEYIERRQ